MKQPRVPEYRESEGAAKYLRALNLFLKDFCMDAWTANRLAEKRVPKVEYPVTSVNGQEGDVVLGAADVGALSCDPQEDEAAEAPQMGSAPRNADLLGGKSLADIMLMLYPVGSIYMSMNGVNPQMLFGGEWEQLKDRFLLGAGDSYSAGETGGEAAHTLTIEEMPNHTHLFYGACTGETKGITNTGNDWAPTTKSWTKDTNTYEGGDQPHNNMPPYLAVYMWKRVS